ncbi:MFS transporter [Streptomyces sp. NPDC097619]|uniref:MFS transporter n=1 Tax=Streptomyces sp. NPDC097619 TaxID=3157228 RepID=UPI00331C715D
MSTLVRLPSPVPAPPPPRGRWLALPVLLAAVFMTTLDFFIVNAVAPATRQDLGAGQSAVQFVLVGYGLAYAVGLITAGRLGDLLGPRRVFVAGLALFTVASAVCGAAPGVGVLIGARVAQGVAAALMGPQVLALLGLLYKGPDRARAFAWYGAAVGVAGTGGQAVGGLLLAADPAGLGWRTCFLVNVPLGLAALALTRLLPEGERVPRGTAGNRLDPWGTALSAAGLFALVFPLVVGCEYGWPLWAWASLAAALPLGLAFRAQQRQRMAAGHEPLVDPGLFRDRRFTRGLISVALLFGVSAGLTFTLSVFLQEGRGMSAMAAGAVCTALNAAFLAASGCTGRLTGRFGDRLPVLGAGVLAAGLVVTAWSAVGAGTGGVPLGLVGGLAVTGAGMGLLMAPLTAGALAGVGQRRAGSAAGVLGTAQEAASVLGIVLTALVFFGLLGPAGAEAPGVGAGAWLGAFRGALGGLAVVALLIAVIHGGRGRWRRRLGVRLRLRRAEVEGRVAEEVGVG